MKNERKGSREHHAKLRGGICLLRPRKSAIRKGAVFYDGSLIIPGLCGKLYMSGDVPK